MKELKTTFWYYSAVFLVTLPVFIIMCFFVYLGFVVESSVFSILSISSIIFASYLFYKGLAPFLLMLYYIHRLESGQARLLSQSGCSIRQGALGAGKTASAGYEIVLKSSAMWHKLQVDYMLMKVQAPQWYKDNDKDNLLKWNEVKSAYNYYITHPDVAPCIFSNIPIKINGKYASKFTVEHALQLKRLPAYTCVLCDELERMFDQNLHMEKSMRVEKVKEFFRFFRQFLGNGVRFIGTEQNADSAFKGLRNVMITNDYVRSQTSVLLPQFLLWLLNRKENKLLSKPNITELDVAKFLKFRTYVNSIGFRVFDYVILGNVDHNFIEPDEVRLYAPMTLNFSYDDRAFMSLYSAKNNKVTATTFHSTLVDPCDKVLTFLSKAEKQAIEDQKTEKKHSTTIFTKKQIKHRRKLLFKKFLEKKHSSQPTKARQSREEQKKNI